MKIQFLSWQLFDYKGIDCALLSEPFAFDSYDINIIDLSYLGVWKCETPSLTKSIYKQDFNNLRQIISYSKRKNTIFLLPQDGDIYFNCGYNYSTNRKEYSKSKRLKNSLYYIVDNLKEIGYEFIYGFGFEKNRYLLDDKEIFASFFFKNDTNYVVLQKAVDSEKPLTIKYDETIFTFLDLNSEDKIRSFLKNLGLLSNNDIPDWLINYDAFDDKTLKGNIDKQKKIIEEANGVIGKNSLKLENNNFYKQILCVNGSELVSRVFKILDEMLSSNLSSDFVDEKKEDFLIKHNGITFIGEIKGVTTNVRNEHISQVENHLSIYEDKLQEEGKNEELKKILIINHQRNSDVSHREQIHINQINKAKKENTLIIETVTLLKLLSKYRNKEIDSDYVFKIFQEEIGVLKIDD